MPLNSHTKNENWIIKSIHRAKLYNNDIKTLLPFQSETERQTEWESRRKKGEDKKNHINNSTIKRLNFDVPTMKKRMKKIRNIWKQWNRIILVHLWSLSIFIANPRHELLSTSLLNYNNELVHNQNGQVQMQARAFIRLVLFQLHARCTAFAVFFFFNVNVKMMMNSLINICDGVEMVQPFFFDF